MTPINTPPRSGSMVEMSVTPPLSRVASQLGASFLVTPDQLHLPEYAGYWDATERLESLKLAPPPPWRCIVRPEFESQVNESLAVLATVSQPLSRRRAARVLRELSIVTQQQREELASTSRATSQASLHHDSSFHRTPTAPLPLVAEGRVADPLPARVSASSRHAAPSVVASTIGVEEPAMEDERPIARIWRRALDSPLVPNSLTSLGWAASFVYEAYSFGVSAETASNRLNTAQVDRKYIWAEMGQPLVLSFVTVAMYLRANRRARKARAAARPAGLPPDNPV